MASDREIRLPPLHDLLAFEAAARHLSFLEASRELHVTQSAISHRIKSLESSVGVPLFIRVNRNIALTTAGEGYLAEVREAIARLSKATARLAASTRMRLRISAAPALGAKWLVARLSAFQQAHPHIELSVSTSNDLTSIQRGRCDIGICYGAEGADGLAVTPFLRESLFPVASPRFRTASGALSKPEDLRHAPLLRHPLLRWKPWFEAAHLNLAEPSSGPIFEDATLMYEAVAAGQGVALILRTVFEGYADEERLVRPFDIAVWDRAYSVVHSADDAGNPAIALFRNWLTRLAGGENLE